MNRPKIVAIMGKSSAGKDSIQLEILRRNSLHYNRIISHTTRPPRDYEKEGFDYHFVSRSEMAQKIFDGEMLEVSSFRDWFYGTSLSSLDKRKVNIGVFNPEGVEALRDADVDLLVFYIEASDKLRMLRSLTREENPNVHEIIRRFSTDEKDFSDVAYLYDIKVNNDNMTSLSEIAIGMCEIIDNWAE